MQLIVFNISFKVRIEVFGLLIDVGPVHVGAISSITSTCFVKVVLLPDASVKLNTTLYVPVLDV